LTAVAPNTTGNPEQGSNAGKLFPLDAPEFAVRFKSGAKIFRHVFRRTTAPDWEAYYAAISESANEGDEAESSYQEGSFVLYDRTILRVEGYQTRNGRKPEELPTWPHCVPLEHRLFAVGVLYETMGSIAKDTFTFAIGAGDTTVSFVVIRDEDESPTSKQFFGVTHQFSLPTADHWRRFVSARSKFPALYGAVISLYDELAVFAEGYSVGGMPIASEQLQREMFVPHKIYAVAALFFFLSDCDPEPRRTKPITVPADFLRMKAATQLPRTEIH